MLTWKKFTTLPAPGQIIAFTINPDDAEAFRDVFTPEDTEALDPALQPYLVGDEGFVPMVTWVKFQHLWVVEQAFGVRLFKDRNCSKELSKDEYAELKEHGYWARVADLFRAVPVLHGNDLCAIEGAADCRDVVLA